MHLKMQHTGSATRTAWTVAVWVLFVSPFASAQVPVREIAVAARSAMVTIHTYEDGEEIAFGSGFFIREDGVLVTNLHVVEGATSVGIEVDSGEIFDNVFVLGVDERRDLLILQIPLTGASILEVDDDRKVEVGDQVYVIGNPLGLQGTFSDGLVSAKRVEEGVAYLQISAPISEGSSGGPVLNSNGRVIGVSTLTISDGQNLNLAVPARYAADLLKISDERIPFDSLVADMQESSSSVELGRHEEFQAYMDALPSEARAELASLSSFQQQAFVRLIIVGQVIEEGGYTSTENVESDVLATGEIGRVNVDLDKGHYMALGTCDDDCADLDLYVLNGDGVIIASDVLDDATPMPEFEIKERGIYTLGVKMESCDIGDCVYAVDVYKQN